MTNIIADLAELKRILLNEGSHVGARICKDAIDYISKEEINVADYNELGDTYIDWQKDCPLKQWRIIAGMLSKEGLKVVKK